MADLSVKNRASYIQFENPAGQLPFSLPNLRLQDGSFDWTPMSEQTEVKPKGNTYQSGSQPGLEWGEGTANFNFGFVSIMYLLKMLGASETKTAVGSSSFKREFVPGRTPSPVSHDYGDPAVLLERYLHTFLTGLAIKADLKTINVTGPGKSKEVRYGVTGASPIINVPQVQANPPRDGLFFSDTYGGLGSVGAETPAPVNDFVEFNWAVGQMIDTVAVKKPSAVSWDRTLETDTATGDMTIKLGKNSTWLAYLSKIRTGQPFFTRYLIRGPEIEAGTAEVQTINLSGDDDPTGGVWPLTILGKTIVGIPWDVPAATLQAVINSLDAYGARDVTVSKTGFVYTITYPSYLGNVAQATSDNGIGLTGAGGDTFAITEATTTPGVASVLYLFALDCGVNFASHFKYSDVAPLSTLDFPLKLRQNSDLNGWKATVITPIDDLKLAA